jgi:hypothetical protein
LGDLRALSQTISYEVRLAFILLSFVVLVCRYHLVYFNFFGFVCDLISFLSLNGLFDISLPRLKLSKLLLILLKLSLSLFQDLMLNMLLMGLPLFFWQSMQVLFL